MKNFVGQWGEQHVQQYIKKMGWKVIALNFHSRFGEIDIIAKDHNEIVFIEVKTRTDHSFGEPQEAVTKKKLQKMLKTAEWYLLQTKQEKVPYRFDVFSVFEKDGIVTVEHFPNVSLL
jgi:putative endonuclease